MENSLSSLGLKKNGIPPAPAFCLARNVGRPSVAKLSVLDMNDRLGEQVRCKSPKRPVRQDPQGGWLDELDRLEGGRLLCLDVALLRAYFELLKIAHHFHPLHLDRGCTVLLALASVVSPK